MGVIPETDLSRINSYCQEHTPTEHADRVRVVSTVRGKTVTILESHAWHSGVDDWVSTGVARMKYDVDSTAWTLYWSDSNSRWHLYDFIEPGSISSLLEEIERDPTNIFWG